MSKKTVFKVPTTEEQIATIQKKLAENPPAREFAVLTGQLARLTGAIKRSRQQEWRDKQQEQEQQFEPANPEILPRWWNDHGPDFWARIFIAEGRRTTGNRWTEELNRAEERWAAEEGKTVEQLREELQRKWRAQGKQAAEETKQ